MPWSIRITMPALIISLTDCRLGYNSLFIEFKYWTFWLIEYTFIKNRICCWQPINLIYSSTHQPFCSSMTVFLMWHFFRWLTHILFNFLVCLFFWPMPAAIAAFLTLLLITHWKVNENSTQAYPKWLCSLSC